MCGLGLSQRITSTCSLTQLAHTTPTSIACSNSFSHAVRPVAPRSMAKSTNHTAHNQSYKNHRNGIKKPESLGKGQRRSCKGVR